MGGLRLTEQEFTTVKQLLAKGYEGQKVAEIVGRGTGTVSMIKNSATLADYNAKTRQPKPQKTKQLELDVPSDKRADVFTAINKVIDAIYDYQLELSDRGALSQINTKAIEIATQKLEECRMWLKTYV